MEWIHTHQFYTHWKNQTSSLLAHSDIVSDVMSICKIVDVVFRNDILLYDVKSETTTCKTPVFEQLLL